MRFRTCSNPAPEWNGMDCPGTNIYTESCNLQKCKGTCRGRCPYLRVFSSKYLHLLKCSSMPLAFHSEAELHLIYRMFYMYNCINIAVTSSLLGFASRKMAKLNT